MKRFRKVYLEITNFCNLNCEFCLPTVRKLQFIDVQDFEFILTKIKPYTDLIYLHLKGEPLLHPNINELLGICDKYHIKVNLTTNGTLINRLKYTKPIRQINFSLHSLSENKLKINVHNYFEEIFKFMDDNQDLIYSLRLWNINKSNNEDVVNKIKDKFHLENFDARSIKLKDKVYLNQEEEFIWPHPDNESLGDTGFCYGLRDQIGILVDGTVVPCCLDGDGIINLGNIFNEEMDIILNSQLAKDIYDGFSNRKAFHPLCKKCGFKDKF